MADADLPDAAAALDPALRRQLTVRRIVQFAADLSVMTLVCLIPVGLMWLLVPRSPDGTMKLFFGFLALCLVLVLCFGIALAYWVWLPGRAGDGILGGGGQTLAMRWFRLRIVDHSGAPASRSQLAVRWILLLVDGIGFGLVGVLAMLTSPRAQRIGDLLAGGLVVRVRGRSSATPRGRAAVGRDSHDALDPD